MHRLRHIASLAAAVAVAALAAGTAGAYSGNPCHLLTSKQVAALGVGTGCTQRTGKPNPYYKGVSAIWGKLGVPTGGSVVVAVNKVASPAYVKVFKSQQTSGKSVGVGSFSRGACAGTGRYCNVLFITGTYVVEMQLAVPASHKLSLAKAVAMAKLVAAEL